MTTMCSDCQRPKATPAHWSNNHGDGDGCECVECVSVCWGDTAYCDKVARERELEMMRRAALSNGDDAGQYRIEMERLRAQLAERDAEIERLKTALQGSYAVVKRAFVAEGLDGAGRVYTDVQPHAQVRIKVALRAHIDAVLARSGKK